MHLSGGARFFYLSLHDGDWNPEFRQCLKTPEDANHRGGFREETPLMWSACAGNEEIVLHLIRIRADVNMVDRDGWTALHHATRGTAHPRILKFLVDAGANLEARTQSGNDMTPLLVCILGRRRDDVFLNFMTLARLGADITARTGKGYHAWDVALDFHDETFARSLYALSTQYAACQLARRSVERIVRRVPMLRDVASSIGKAVWSTRFSDAWTLPDYEVVRQPKEN